MQALFEVILPVFLVIGFGYIARWRSWIDDVSIDAIMSFAQNFAVPTLLFAGIAKIDVSQSFQPPLLLSFYTGAFTSGILVLLIARYGFGRPMQDAVAIGFIGLFSNSVLLGLPITERAYGSDALQWNFAIISIHTPLLLGSGIALMETVKARGMGLSLPGLLAQITRSTLKNPLILGIISGWTVNVLDIPLHVTIWDAIGLMNRAAIPAAIFAMGGVLYRYKPDGDFRIMGFAIAGSLLLHPAIAYGLGKFAFDLEVGALRSLTLAAAMAPGINTYLFAHMYGVGKRIAASSVLLGTAFSVLTVWGWLHLLP